MVRILKMQLCEMKSKEEIKFKHGDEVIASFGDKTFEARVELRMVGQYPSQKEELYLNIPGRWPCLLSDWPGTIELK
jgi:hypothetical protein